MKKDLLQASKVLLLGLILSAGISFADGIWAEPECAPPDCNTWRPVDISPEPQWKSGDLYVMGEAFFDEEAGDLGAVDGMLYTERFFASGPSVFSGSVDVGLEDYPNNWLRVTGKLGVNLDSPDGGVGRVPFYDAAIPATQPTKELDVNGDARIRNLSGATSGSLCAGTDGTLTRCEAVEDVVDDTSFYEANIITVNSGDILFHQGWKSCPATHPHPIGGGGRCFNDGIGEGFMIESQPSRGSTTHWTNLDGPDELPYSWWVKCEDSTDVVTVYAICSK